MLLISFNQNRIANSYYHGQGQYQSLSDKLFKKIRKYGSVENSNENKNLEQFRIAWKCYYDLHNMHLLNMGREFWETYNIKATPYKSKSPPFFREILYYLAEAMLDRFLISAALEQGLEVDDEVAAFKMMERNKTTITSIADRLVGVWVNRDLPDLPIVFSRINDDGYGFYREGYVTGKYKILQEDKNNNIVNINVDFCNGNTRNDELHIPKNGLVFASNGNNLDSGGESITLVYSYIGDCCDFPDGKNLKNELPNSYDLDFFYKKNNVDIVMALCGLSALYAKFNETQKKYINGLSNDFMGREEFILLGKSGSMNYLLSKVIHEKEFLKQENLKTILEFFDKSYEKNLKPIDTHKTYSSIINICHYKREYEGFLDICIKYCYEHILFSRKNVKKSNRKYLGHEAYKRLSILYNKQGEYGKVIQLCSDALKEGWMGDWEERIDRNSKLLCTKINGQAAQLEKEKKYKEAADIYRSALEMGLEGDWEYKIWKMTGNIE